MFILAATSRKLKRVFLPSLQTTEEVLGVKYDDLPIPDEPRNRNTRGCSSSYQPFSFLLMATACRERERGRKKRILLFHSFALVDFPFASFTQLNEVDMRAAGMPETMIKE